MTEGSTRSSKYVARISYSAIAWLTKIQDTVEKLAKEYLDYTIPFYKQRQRFFDIVREATCELLHPVLT